MPLAPNPGDAIVLNSYKQILSILLFWLYKYYSGILFCRARLFVTASRLVNFVFCVKVLICGDDKDDDDDDDDNY